MSEDQKTIVERTAWPAGPLDTYTSIKSGEWGYLVVYSDGSFDFDKSNPSEEEIVKRWGFHFKRI